MTDHSFDADQLELLAQLLEAEGVAPTTTIKPRPATAGVPLSFGQKRLWFLEQLKPGQPLYNVPVIFRLTGSLQVAALQQSLLTLLQRHTALCTALVTVAGQPQPVITPPSAFTLPVTDLQTTPDPEAAAQTLIAAEIHRPFDLSQSPLLRASLLQLSAQEHVLILVIHHIATDGWSMGIFVRELAALYGAYTRQEPNPLPLLTLQYADFAHWQNEWFQSPAFAEQLAYWKEQLKGQPALLELPTDHPRPAVQTFQGGRQRFVIPPPLLAALKELSRHESATLFMTLFAAFQTLLYRYTGQTDISVGTPIAGREHVELEPLVGFFINTLVLRSQFAGQWTFRQLLQHVREVTLSAYTHQAVPFEKLVEVLQPERNLSHPPLFQVMFVLQNTPDEDPELVGLTGGVIPTTLEIAKFDLTLLLTEMEQGISAFFEYNTALFEAATLERMAHHYLHLLESVVANPDQRLCHIPLLSPAEQELFRTWNATDSPYPHSQSAHQLFAAQAARTPNAVALAYAQQTLSYQELDERANQLAHHLQALGVGSESLVAVCLERSLEVLVALLGVLKAGGAFVPIDPTYPPERLAFMLEDSGARILLTQQRLLARLPAHTAQVVCVDTAETFATQPTTPPPAEISPNQLAYIIYTSGSTGRPKGAMITQRGLVNYLTWGLQYYQVAAGTGAPLHSSLSFDLTITSLFMPLLAGKTVVMFREDQGGPALATALPAEANYSLLKLTPAHLEVLNQQLAPSVAQNCARVMIVGGEALWGSMVTFWQTHAPQMRIINEYGPTETVVGCCVLEVPPNIAPTASIPIGYPIANTQLYVLDANFWPVPVGVTGELYIGGDGVGRGYWQRPALTAEKFVPDPFSRTPGARLYRTGDLARYQPNGCLEYLGRTDNQVKVRGFRIELGEIEAAVRQHPGVQEAAVIVWDDATAGKRLVAYLTLQAGSTLTPGDLRAALKETLPEYMVPTSYVILPELPLTPNGKVDRRALPPPEVTRATLTTTYVAPETEVEQTIATVWKECLRLERVGLHDNFFELGGHSLLLVQVHHQLGTALKRDIPIVALFQHPTISALAKSLSQETPAAAPVDRTKELASGKDRLKQLQQKQRAANTARKN